MADFDPAFRDVVDRKEGKWGLDKKDPGAETYKGIARAFYPDDPIWPLIDAAKARPGFPHSLESNAELQARVKDHYRKHEWSEIRGQEIPSQAVATELLDNATLEGAGVSVTLLQFGLNAMNRGATIYPDLVVDGGFGIKTLDALTLLLKIDGPADLVKLLNGLQLVYLLIGKMLIEFLRAHPTPAWRESFIRGWLGRVSLA